MSHAIAIATQSVLTGPVSIEQTLTYRAENVNVNVVDINADRIAAWNSDELPIFEVSSSLYIYMTDARQETRSLAMRSVHPHVAVIVIRAYTIVIIQL